MSLKEGMSKDKIASAHDLEMRYGHASYRPRFDVHEVEVVDTDTQPITAVHPFPRPSPPTSQSLRLLSTILPGNPSL